MHNRQSGAAHVPIMFFLILLIMFLGALGFAYVTQTTNGQVIKERNEAQAEAKTLRSRALLVEHYIEDLGRVIAKPGKYEGRPGSVALYNGATLEHAGVMNPDEIKKVLDDNCTAAHISVATGLENVLGALVTRLSQQEQRVKDIESERDKALAEKAEIDKKFQVATSEATKMGQDFKQNVEQQRADFENAKQSKDANIASLGENLRNKTDELTSAKEAASQKEKELRYEITKQQTQVSAMVARDQLRNPPDVADGKILVARNGIPTAFINLGRKDLLQPGTVFRVKNPNNDKVKGYATVTRVEESRAEVSLADFVDPVGDYAREGDLLFNDLYTPRVTRTIYLMGSFTAPYNKPQLTDLLKRLGNRVVDKMKPGVDTVILGNNPVNEAQDGFTSVEESPEFKLASDLNVEFTYLKTIRDLIKL